MNVSRVLPVITGAAILVGLLAPAGIVEAQSAPAAARPTLEPPPASTALVPDGAWIAVGWSGARALEPAFLGTGLGEVIAEPRIQELSTVISGALDRVLHQRVHDAEDRAGLLFARETAELLWSEPAAISVLGLDFSGPEPIPQITFCLHGGEKAHQVFDAIENLREREGVPAEPHPDAAHARRVHLPEGSSSLTYGIERGRFFAAVGDEATTAMLARIRGQFPSIEVCSNFTRARSETFGESVPAAWLFVDTPQIIAAVKHHLAASDAALPVPVAALLDDDALGRLGPVMGSVGIEGKGFRRALSIGWRGDSAPSPTLDDETLALVPRDTSFFSYEDCDLAGIVRSLRTFAEGMDPEVARNIRNAKAVIDGFLGFRLEEDFLANLGRRFLVFEEPSATGILPGLCFVLQPNDGETIQDCVKRVTTSLGALARMQGAEVAIRERGGMTFIDTAGVPNPLAPAWAARGERLFLALHPTVLEEVLHRVDAPDLVERSILANPDFIAARERIHGDLHGVFYTDTADVVAELYPMVIPLLQAGLSALGTEARDLNAALLPPPYVLNERMFGDIHGYRRDASGWHWEAHGPFPATVMDYGSPLVAVLAAVGLGGTVVGAREEAQVVATRAAQAAMAAEEAHAATGVPVPMENVTVTDHTAVAIHEALQSYAETHGSFPASLTGLGLESRLLERGGEARWKYAGALSTTPADRVLFHSTAPLHGHLYLLVDTEGDQELVTKEALDARVKASNWPRRTRL